MKTTHTYEVAQTQDSYYIWYCHECTAAPYQLGRMFSRDGPREISSFHPTLSEAQKRMTSLARKR